MLKDFVAVWFGGPCSTMTPELQKAAKKTSRMQEKDKKDLLEFGIPQAQSLKLPSAEIGSTFNFPGRGLRCSQFRPGRWCWW